MATGVMEKSNFWAFDFFVHLVNVFPLKNFWVIRIDRSEKCTHFIQKSWALFMYTTEILSS